MKRKFAYISNDEIVKIKFEVFKITYNRNAVEVTEFIENVIEGREFSEPEKCQCGQNPCICTPGRLEFLKDNVVYIVKHNNTITFTNNKIAIYHNEA